MSSLAMAGMLAGLSLFSMNDAQAQEDKTQIHIRPAAFHLPRTPTGEIYKRYGANSFDEWGPGAAVEKGVSAGISIGIGGYQSSEPGKHWVKNPIVVSFDLYRAPGFRAGVRVIPFVAGYKGKKGLYRVPFTNWDAFPAILPYAEIDVIGDSGISLSPLLFPKSGGWQFIQSGTVYFSTDDIANAVGGIKKDNLPDIIKAGTWIGKGLKHFSQKQNNEGFRRLSFSPELSDLPDISDLYYENRNSGLGHSNDVSKELDEVYEELADLGRKYNAPDSSNASSYPIPVDDPPISQTNVPAIIKYGPNN